MARKTLDEVKQDLGAGTPDFDRAYEQAGRDIAIGELVRRLRKRAGLTQAELAQRMSTSQSAVTRLEAGGTTPTIDTLERVAAAVGAHLTIAFEADAPTASEVLALS